MIVRGLVGCVLMLSMTTALGPSLGECVCLREIVGTFEEEGERMGE